MAQQDLDPELMWINAVNTVNKIALKTWVKTTGINLVQVNGQRKYGGPPPGWVGEGPGCGSEVFIGKLPQDMYEDKLIPLFQSIGKLYEFRLMMTFSGLNRGFAYARYMNRRSATAAITALNGHEIQKGSRIVVCKSTEKCELSLDGLPCLLEQEQLKLLLQSMTTGLVELSLHPSPAKKIELMAVVKYSSHRAAAMAKKKLVEDTQLLCGHPLTVDWLKCDLKQKLCNPSAHALDSRWRINPQPSLCETTASLQCDLLLGAVATLNTLCQRMKFGKPVFLTKFLNLSSCGWLRFWYQVVIPGYVVPFSGYEWFIGENLPVEEKHEKAKEVVALKILTALGYTIG
ncbi:hypothetical protein FKM82_011975 [Ascaphus truei]